jgi:hypothetical protein
MESSGFANQGRRQRNCADYRRAARSIEPEQFSARLLIRTPLLDLMNGKLAEKEVRAQHAVKHVAPSKSSRKVSGFSSPGSSTTMKGGLHWRPRFSIRRLNSLAACRVFQTDAYSPANLSIRPGAAKAVRLPRHPNRTSKPLKSGVRRMIATAVKPPQLLYRSASPRASRASLASQSP